VAGELLHDEPAEGVLRLTISNPSKRNALDHAILAGIAERLGVGDGEVDPLDRPWSGRAHAPANLTSAVAIIRATTSKSLRGEALTGLNATAMVVGTIIGASIVVQPSEIARHLQTPSEIMTVWIACGVLTLFGALVCAELASAFPQTGGVYVFMRDAFSPVAGFLWGWAMFWSMHSGIIAAIAVVFARYAAVFIPIGEIAIRATAVILILVLTLLNYVGVRAGSRTQTAFTIAKLVAIASIVTVGYAVQVPPHLAAVPPPTTLPHSTSAAGFLLAMVAGLFAYGGWHMVTYTAGETRMPARTIPAALLWGVAIVTTSYAALNLVYLRVLPIDAVRTSTRIAADAADALAGRGGAGVMAVLVMVSSAGALTGIVLTGPRVYFAMARDGLAPRWLEDVHPRFGTPARAIVLQGIWSSVLAATGAFRQLFTTVVYTEWLFFALMAAGLFVLRRRPTYQPSYRCWGYPIVPIVFVLSSLAIVVNQFASTPGQAAVGLGLVALGAPIYYLRHAHR
jgi:APA family basic amino acid/polyamine antiporter